MLDESRIMDGKTALILEGGGCKGAFEAGIIKYLHEKQIKIDLVGGTSVGGLNAACFAFGKIDELLDLWSNISNSQVYSPGNFVQVLEALKPEELEDVKNFVIDIYQRKPGSGFSEIFDVGKDILKQTLLLPELLILSFEIILNLIKKGSVLDNTPLRNRCAKLFDQKKVTDSVNPRLFLTAFQLQTGQDVYFGNDKNKGDLDGSVVDVLLATSAIQGIFPVKELDGRQYIDGGNGANLPLTYAVNHDCDLILLARDNMAANATQNEFRNPIATTLRAYLSSFTNATARDIQWTNDISKRLGKWENDLQSLQNFSSQITDRDTQAKYLDTLKKLQPVFETDENKRKITIFEIVPDWTPSNIIDFNSETSKRLIQDGYNKAAEVLEKQLISL